MRARSITTETSNWFTLRGVEELRQVFRVARVARAAEVRVRDDVDTRRFTLTSTEQSRQWERSIHLR